MAHDETYRTMGIAMKVRDTAHALAAALRDADEAKLTHNVIQLANDILGPRGFRIYRQTP